MYHPLRDPRRGAAAVEFAFVAPLLFLLILGVWEIGRIIQVQQVMLSSLRHGARIASQGYIVTTTGEYTKITRDQVLTSIKESLIGNGITNLDGAKVEMLFLDGESTREPHQGKKNERYSVRLTIPYQNVRWTNLSLLNPQSLTVEIQWQMLVDDPFTLNTNLPTWSYP
jgi:hypothetical protein